MLTGSEYDHKQCGQNIFQHEKTHNRSSNPLVAAKLCRRSRAETCVYTAGEVSRDRLKAAVPYANLLLSPSINMSGIIPFFCLQKEGERKRKYRLYRLHKSKPIGRSLDRHEEDDESSPALQLGTPALAVSHSADDCATADRSKHALKLPLFILESRSVFRHLAYSKH